MKINVDINITPPIYQPFLTDYSKPQEFYFGSRNSGKSWFVFDKAILLSLNDPNSVTVIVRKYRNSLKESSFKNITDRLSQWKIKYYENKTDLVIELPNKARFLFVGCDDPDKIKSIARMDRIIYEECDSLTKEEYDVVSGSMRGDSQYKFESFMFNPPRDKFWLFDYYLKDVDLEELYKSKILENDHFRCIHTTWRDNNFADQDRLERKYDYMREHDYFRWLRDSEGRMGYSESEFCLVPYKYIDQATKTFVSGNDRDLAIGIDCARFGSDSTIITPRYGDEVLMPIRLKGKRGHEIAEFTLNYALELKTKYKYKGKIAVSVDDTGLGASTSDSIYKLKKDNKDKYKTINLLEINFGNKAVNEDLYGNLISEIAFSIKDLMINGKIKIPDIPELKEEISLREYKLDKKNRQILESKDEFKKKYGKSPDYFDSLLMAFANRVKRRVVIC